MQKKQKQLTDAESPVLRRHKNNQLVIDRI